MKIDPNAPAFPGDAFSSEHNPGMTIRATMAMHLAAGILAGGMADGSSLTSSSYQPIAKSAVALADALLDELNEGEVQS